MFHFLQHTIKNEISCFGIGLHSGIKTKMKLIPSAPDTGIVFKRTDICRESAIVKANYNLVTKTLLGTTITNEYGVSVATTEHLMAALWGCKIDNVIIELDNIEVPIMDGSSEPFVFMIECAGIVEQEKGRNIIEILKKFELKIGDSIISVSPHDRFEINMSIDFDDNIISKQNCKFDSDDYSFKTDISRARTFGFAREVEQLRKSGLALGGSLDNAIVIDNDQILNKEGLRYNDEFVKHKIIDSIGDFYLSGGYFKGRFNSYKSGHAINNQFLKKLFDNKDCYRKINLPI